MESVEHNDDADTKYAEVTGVGLEGCLVGQGISVDPVACEPLIKAHICDQDSVPSDERCDRRNTDEPLKDGASILGHVQVCKESGKHLYGNLNMSD